MIILFCVFGGLVIRNFIYELVVYLDSSEMVKRFLYPPNVDSSFGIMQVKCYSTKHVL